METILHEKIATALSEISIDDCKIAIENVSHKHASHFTGNGNTHFVITVESNSLFAKKPLESILNNATANLMNDIHSISFKVVGKY
jgi:stress-induced morphogen